MYPSANHLPCSSIACLMMRLFLTVLGRVVGRVLKACGGLKFGIWIG